MLNFVFKILFKIEIHTHLSVAQIILLISGVFGLLSAVLSSVAITIYKISEIFPYLMMLPIAFLAALGLLFLIFFISLRYGTLQQENS